MDKQWTHLKLKNGDKVQFIPPAPNGEQLGGVTQDEREQIDKNKSDLEIITSTEMGEVDVTLTNEEPGFYTHVFSIGVIMLQKNASTVSRCYTIDVSDYIGKPIYIRYNTTSTTSAIGCGLVDDENHTLRELYVVEKENIDGVVDFTVVPTDTYHTLLVSKSPYMSNLVVKSIGFTKGTALDFKKNFDELRSLKDDIVDLQKALIGVDELADTLLEVAGV